MQKKKVLLLTYGSRDHASSRIRGINHFERLKDEFETTWLPRIPLFQRDTLWEKIGFAVKKRIYILRQYWAILFRRFDIVFIQIIFLPEFFLKVLKKKKTVICYDFDDAVYTYSRQKFEVTLKYSDKLITATPFLTDYISGNKKNCLTLPSPVDTEQIKPSAKPEGIFTVGWIGSPWTVSYLHLLKDAFMDLSQKLTFKLIIVGGTWYLPGVEVESINWSLKNELDALAKIDIGIMPLPDDEWAKMKGGYKLYLYMAAGKPVIASPSGINSLIVKEGINGYLATTKVDWEKAIAELQGNINLLHGLGLNARKDAEQIFSYNVCTKRLDDFLNK